jgi:hypothetical protein
MTGDFPGGGGHFPFPPVVAALFITGKEQRSEQV